MLETKRLHLSIVTPALLHELFENNDSSFLMNYFGTDEKGLEHYASLHTNGMEAHRHSLIIIRILLKNTDLVIGECGFHTWNTFHRNAELFYRLHQDTYKNKGLMSEVLPDVLDYAFNSMNLHRIEAKIAEDNTPSLRLLLKNGFKLEGRHREDYLVDNQFEDSIIYSKLKSD